MRWKKENKTLNLGPCDLQIMAMCGIHMEQLMKPNPHNENIPPLWSVLSYVMLQCNTDVDHVWYRYRKLSELAEDSGAGYYLMSIPKRGYGLRRISVPSHLLRAQQEFILEHILSELSVSDRAYAYRKGRSAADCAGPHVGREVLLHLDISDFFGSVTENMVYEMFCRETGYGKSLCRFLARLCCLRGSLPQGTVTSPMLSNIVFRSCDDALERIAQAYGMEYTRYSDDLFFSGDGDVPVGEILKEIEWILRSCGFRLNEKKTKVLRRQRRQEILGLTVNDRIQVTREYRRQLMQELHYLEKFGKNCDGAIACGDYLRYMQQLQGKLAYVLHIDPDNEKLKSLQRGLLLRINRQMLLRE